MTKSLRLSKELQLNRQHYDPFIDFLKGICIIFVIMNHCMPEKIMLYSAFFFWGVSAVPIFLILQTFHTYKKGFENTIINYKRIWNKIILPFIIAEIIIFIFYLIKDKHFNLQDIRFDLILFYQSGGYGPGAYYPWIYLQFAFILPLITWLFKLNKIFICIFFILLSQLAETACSFFSISQIAYKLLFIRYIFLIYLGYLLVYKGYILNIYTFCLACISLIISSFIVFFQPDLSPILYNFVRPPVCHWFCYLYIAFILLFILKILYQYTERFNRIKNFILKTGKYSYEIFIFQMMYFSIVDEYLDSYLRTTLINTFLYDTIRILLPVFVCTFPVIILKEKEMKL